MSVTSLVKGCPLFHEIFDHEIEEVLKKCFVASYEKGDHLITQGDSGTDIGVILSGRAMIRVEKDESFIDIVEIGQGDLYGELVLINEVKRTAHIVATERCEVLLISQDTFYSFFEKKPELFALMVLNVTRLITKRLKNTNMIIERLNAEVHKKNAA